MQFIETLVFSRQARELFSDEAFRLLETALARRPDAGSLIPGSRGLRKLRWPLEGRGKRGGARVIYYLHLGRGRLYLLYVYAKNDRTDLTIAELRAIREGLPNDDEGE